MYKAGQEWMKSFDTIKIGDPVKGVERIWDVVQSDKPLPSRLALGVSRLGASRPSIPAMSQRLP